MAKPTTTNSKKAPRNEVRDQDGIAQGVSGKSGHDPRTQSRGQGAHAYSKQDPDMDERDKKRREDRITPQGDKVRTPFK